VSACRWHLRGHNCEARRQKPVGATVHADSMRPAQVYCPPPPPSPASVIHAISGFTGTDSKTRRTGIQYMNHECFYFA
jgi:Ni,Fe-hydrogenase III small subunit